MPLLGTRGAASARGFGFGAASSSSASFLSTYSSLSTSLGISAGVCDSAGNMYYFVNQGTTLLKYTSGGVLSFQKQYTISGFTPNGGSIAIDSSDNIYLITGDTSNYLFHIIKVDTSGAFISSKRLASSNAEQLRAASAQPVIKGNILFIGLYQYPDMYILGWNTSSESVSFYTRLIPQAGSGDAYTSLCMAQTANYVYAGVFTNSSYNQIVYQFNTSGYTGTSRGFFNNVDGGNAGIATNLSSDDVYLLAYRGSPSGPGYYSWMFKVNSGLTQASRLLTTPNFTNVWWTRAVVKDGAIYVPSNLNGGGGNSGTIFSFDTGLTTVNWQNYLNILNSGNNRALTMINNHPVINGTNLMVQGSQSEPTAYAIGGALSLPLNGTKTGSYTVGSAAGTLNYTYATASVTINFQSSTSTGYSSGSTSSPTAPTVSTSNTPSVSNLSYTSNITLI